jgi:exodeoxyribonuclease V alpha subunit
MATSSAASRGAQSASPSSISVFRINPDLAEAPAFNMFERARNRVTPMPAAEKEPALSSAIYNPIFGIKGASHVPVHMTPGLERAISEKLVEAQKEAEATLTSPPPPPKPEVVPAPRLVLGEVAKTQLSALARLRQAIAAAPESGLPPMDAEPFEREEAHTERTFTRVDRVERVSAPLEEIEGVLATVKVFNNWAVGSVMTSERLEVRVTGEMLSNLVEGLDYKFKGRPTNHAVHGDGFDVVSCEPMIPDNDDAVERFLVKSFTGIGPAKAEKYIKAEREKGGDEAIKKLRETLLREPWLLDLTAIAKGAKFAGGEDAQEQAKHLMVTRNLMLKLGGLKLREKTAKGLATFLLLDVAKAQAATKPTERNTDLVALTWATLMRNPYAPISKTEGYGFGMAEAVAAAANIPRDSPLRLAALAEYAVDEGCNRKGHTFLSPADFMEAIKKVDPTAGPQAQAALTHAAANKLVVIEGNRVYTPALLAAEKSLGIGLAKLLQDSAPLTKRSAEDVKKKLRACAAEINPAFAKGFDDDQLDSIAGMLTSRQRLHVITGGPGTGKTAMLEATLFLLKQKSFSFCAPTGKASKIMSNRVSKYGYSASTINSLLKGGEGDGFAVNEDEPLECDVLVVDESTMLGVGMAAAVLAALPENAHLIIMGDPGLPNKPGTANSARAGQLPSISPGRFMQDLLLLPNINHLHLTKTYRNSGGILDVVNEVAMGNLNMTDRESVRFTRTLKAPENGFPEVMHNYLETVARDGVEGTLLVMPLRQGDRETPGWNTTYSNHVLRKACNPDGEKLPGTTLHLGDRVLIRENMEIGQPNPEEMGMVRRVPSNKPAEKFDFQSLVPKKGEVVSEEDSFFDNLRAPKGDHNERKERVVNGDTGTIIAYAMPNAGKRMGSPQWVRIALDDGREIEYPGAELSELDHAYALTVHAVQGSEYKNVLVVVTPGSADFMNQNILLTAFSRPQTNMLVFGDEVVVKKIARTPTPARNSALVERVVAALAEREVEKQDDSADAAPVDAAVEA